MNVRSHYQSGRVNYIRFTEDMVLPEEDKKDLVEAMFVEIRPLVYKCPVSPDSEGYVYKSVTGTLYFVPPTDPNSVSNYNTALLNDLLGYAEVYELS